MKRRIPPSQSLKSVAKFRSARRTESCLRVGGSLFTLKSMFVTELQQIAKKLQPDERIYLAGCLRILQLQENPEFRSWMTARLRAMDSGERLTREEFLGLHDSLDSKGL
jgi:hypothetical protein